jgi:hypothetical protein
MGRREIAGIGAAIGADSKLPLNGAMQRDV